MPEDVTVPLTGGVLDGGSSGAVSTGQRAAQTLQIFGISLLLGFFIGWAFKANMATVILLLILVIIITQTAACYGIITIHWKEFKDACKNCLDQDGNGKLDCNDCKLLFQKSYTYILAIAFGSILGFVGAFFLSSQFSSCRG